MAFSIQMTEHILTICLKVEFQLFLRVNWKGRGIMVKYTLHPPGQGII